MNSYVRATSIAVALLTAFIPLMLSEQTRPFWPLYVAFVSLVWIILSEQMLESSKQSGSFEKLESSFRTIVNEIRSQNNDAPSVIQFNDSISARSYIVANARLCKRIYNTRIGSRSNDEGDHHLLRTKNLQDDAVKEANLGGTDYHIVYDESYADQCNQIVEWHRENASPTSGRLTTKIMKANEYPLLQFSVLDFGGRQEILIGWVVADENFVSQDIFLIRSQRLANYFVSLFRIYVQNGLPENE